MEQSNGFNQLARRAKNMLITLFGVDIDCNNSDEAHRWQSFRWLLMNAESIDHLRAEKNFKDGLYTLCNLTDYLTESAAIANWHRDDSEGATERFYILTGFIKEGIFGGCVSGNDEDHKAVVALLHALTNISSDDLDNFGFDDDDISTFRLTLETIAKWQEALLVRHQALRCGVAA